MLDKNSDISGKREAGLRMRGRRLLISVSVFILALLFSVAADRVVGALLYRDVAGEGLVFPPLTEFRLQSAEFDCEVNINALGFRDREFGQKPEGRIRILAVGDSFTYGWGVEANQSWPKVLEARLRQLGHDVEVANLGKPGASPAGYAAIMGKAMPVLKPDLVIVGILQGEDLAQTRLEASINSSARLPDGRQPAAIMRLGLRERVGNVGRLMYPNLLRLMGKLHHAQPSLSRHWKSEAQAIVEMLTPQEQARFDGLDAQVKRAFLNGELNPSLIQTSMKLPRYFLDTFRADKPEIQSLISTVAGSLADIKRMAGRYGCEVIVVSVPLKVYASREELESCRRLGFELIPEMAESDSPDRAIEAACRMAGVQFINVTEEFRKAANGTHLFYEMDGHFNPAGHRVFAELFTPRLLQQWHDAN
ncbi:MAG TPA: GDSL-type esterase/lipase family protein [Pyrinomonadaceae bacterium]|jgi:hypothetical protein